MSKKKTFLRGAAILGGAGIIIKILGAIFRIPLGNMLGDEGMSYYQTAYPTYILLITIAQAGIPTAIAKLVSERHAVKDYYGIRRIFKTSFYLMGTIGVVGFFILYFGAELIVKSAGNDMEAVMSVKAIAPALLFIPLMSVFRGFFQGLQDLKPYAFSQMIEQLFRVILGLSLALYFVDISIPLAAAGATISAAVGGFAGFIFILIYYLRSRDNIFDSEEFAKDSKETRMEVIKKILKIAIPITIGASIIPTMRIIDMFMVMKRLKSIGLINEANDLYGQLTGYANPVINLPSVIFAAVQISLVPAISNLKITDKKKLRQTIETGLRVALILGLPAAVGMVAVSNGIMSILYPSQIEIVDSISKILEVLGWGVAFLSLMQITTGILQGLDKQNLPVINLLYGVVIKIILNFILIGIPSINIYGAAISTVIAYAIASILNVRSVIKHGDVSLNYKKVFIKPVIVAGIMGLIVKLSNLLLLKVLSIRLAAVCGIFIGVISYSLLLFVFKVIDDKDLELIPGGEKIKRIMKKVS